MSPRAACRLATLGFTEVYDYMPGKADWMAHGLTIEGEGASVATAGHLARDDVVTCGLADRIQSVRDRVERSPYGFALVTTEPGILLGRLRRQALTEAPGHATAETAMESGPSTVRAHIPVRELAERLSKGDLSFAIVTTPEGRLIGVVRRRDLEAALAAL